jgi:hypothetical protein
MERLLQKLKDSLPGKSKKKINGKVSDDEEIQFARATAAPASHVKPAAPSSSFADVSSAVTAITQPASIDVAILPSNYNLDPWTLAYEIFQHQEPNLASDYKKHLASLQVDNVSSVNLSSPLHFESIVNRLLEDRKKNQWQVPLLGKDIKIREQVERLAKFVLWSDEIVKSALSAQPYAALAWSGVSMLLPVSFMTLPALERKLTRTASYERHQTK